MNARTHYDTLGLAPDATADEIRRAWKTLIQVWHPDRFAGKLRAEAEEMTKTLNQAYGILSDRETRGRYDAAMNGARATSTSERAATSARPTSERAATSSFKRATDNPEIIDLPVVFDAIINALTGVGVVLFALIAIAIVLLTIMGLALDLGVNLLGAAVVGIGATWIMGELACAFYRRRRSRRS